MIEGKVIMVILIVTCCLLLTCLLSLRSLFRMFSRGKVRMLSRFWTCERDSQGLERGIERPKETHRV